MSHRPVTLVWFRRDLRTADLPTLTRAAERGDVVCLWVADPTIRDRRHHAAPRRVAFLRAGLEALDRDLRDRGGRLVIRSGRAVDVVAQVAQEAGADTVMWTRELTPLGRVRDAAVSARLAQEGIDVIELAGDMHAEPDDLTGSSGRGYLVFTPFWRAWRELPIAAHRPAPQRLSGPKLASERATDVLGGDESPLAAGAEAARATLVAFIQGGAADRYGADRDLPALPGTSGLSPYLRFGMCTSSQIGRALGLPGAIAPGREALWRQICWREFYAHHLARHPHVAHTALREDLRAVAWDNDPAMIDAWQAGRTGYPLVDAGMRQLAATGWMHNRVRMVAASFLIKDLLVDWRIGERIFMQQLIDGDPANNNGGWQWVAGTGTDAAPYFRVLNPVLQAKKFDPDGDYVRRWVPELAGVSGPRVFTPWTMSAAEQAACGCVIGRDYPAPIVDHGERRTLVLERYRVARGADATGD